MPVKPRPQYLVRFPDDVVGVRTIQEAFAIIEKRYPECWPGVELYRCGRHPAGNITKIWARYEDIPKVAAVCQITRLGGLLVCFGSPDPKPHCPDCDLRIACQHVAKDGKNFSLRKGPGDSPPRSSGGETGNAGQSACQGGGV